MLSTSDRLHNFPGLTLVTSLQPDGDYVAVEFDNVDLGCIQGFGKTREAAIEDYADQLDEIEANRRARARAAAEQHNDHCVTRALYAIADALSEGADHDAHVFRRLAYQASLPQPECVILGLVVTTDELRAARESILNGPDDNGVAVA